VLLLLFRNCPSLAARLIRDTLGIELPQYAEARLDSAELTDVQPAEYRADLVVQLFSGTPVLGIIVEVQLSVDERKHFSWPAYVANLRARLKCPVCLLVFTTEDAVAQWAARPIELGGGNQFVPLVLALSSIPVMTDEKNAFAEPELAVLSAMAHGSKPDIEQSVRIATLAQTASNALDPDRSKLYFDLVMRSLNATVKQRLKQMLPFKYEYQSDFAKHYVAEGEARGRVALVTRLLTLRFGELSPELKGQIAKKSADELDLIVERALTASSPQEALG